MEKGRRGEKKIKKNIIRFAQRGITKGEGDNDVNDEYQSSLFSLLHHRCSISSVNAIQMREFGSLTENTCFTTSLLRGAKFRACSSRVSTLRIDGG